MYIQIMATHFKVLLNMRQYFTVKMDKAKVPFEVTKYLVQPYSKVTKNMTKLCQKPSRAKKVLCIFSILGINLQHVLALLPDTGEGGWIQSVLS